MSEPRAAFGRIHSFQSLGTLDGPGVRFVAFLQGCPLRCICCHNPDTWEPSGGDLYTADEVARRALRYREYFGETGGITLSGGEPLLQAGFAAQVFRICQQEGLHTCLDTSGCLWNADVERLLEVTDHVLLDVKYTNDADYRAYVGCPIEPVLRFLAQLDARGIPTTLRQVILPSLNDQKESILALKALAGQYACVQGIELLPFRKICRVKYEQLGLCFRAAEIETPSSALMRRLEGYLADPTEEG